MGIAQIRHGRVVITTAGETKVLTFAEVAVASALVREHLQSVMPAQVAALGSDSTGPLAFASGLRADIDRMQSALDNALIKLAALRDHLATDATDPSDGLSEKGKNE